MSDNRRQKQFIDSAIQGALVRRMAGHWFFFLAVSSFLLLGLRMLSDPFQPFMAHVAGFLQEHIFFFLLMICMTPIFLWDTVKLSNRFVGPVMRVQRALRDLNEGKAVQQVKFRQGDFWPRLADEFNCFLKRQSESQPAATETESDAEADASEPEAVEAVGV